MNIPDGATDVATSDCGEFSVMSNKTDFGVRIGDRYVPCRSFGGASMIYQSLIEYSVREKGNVT